VPRISSAVNFPGSVIRTEQNLGVSKTPLLRIEVQEVPNFSIVADSTSITLTKLSKLLPSYYIVVL